MTRAPFQVLVFPYRFDRHGEIEYAIFSRSDSELDVWQGIAGGGEDDETPLEVAKRETWEEIGLPTKSLFTALDTVSSIPVACFGDSHLWGDEVFVIREYSFGVDASECKITLSCEHIEYKWLAYNNAVELLKWDGNKTALWELNQRLKMLAALPD